MVAVAFYKHRGSWLDKLIRLWTFGPYSHTELIGPDGSLYSADPRLNKVRVLTNYDVTNGHWDIVYLDDLDSDKAIKFVTSQLNKEYDWRGIFLSQVLRLKLHSRNKWFCSELCFVALNKAGLGSKGIKPHTIHPNALFDLLTTKFNGRVVKYDK